MYDIFIKPLDFTDNKYIFFGCFYNLGRIEEIVELLINTPMDGDVVYRLSLRQKYPGQYYSIFVKDSNTDEEILSKIYDTETNKFIEEEEV